MSLSASQSALAISSKFPFERLCSTLAPFGYTQLLWMIASGYFVFGDWPPAATFVGAGLVVGAGLFLVLYERAVGKN